MLAEVEEAYDYYLVKRPGAVYPMRLCKEVAVLEMDQKVDDEGNIKTGA